MMETTTEQKIERKLWEVQDRYAFNPLLVPFEEEGMYGGSSEHIKNERTNLFNRMGDQYWFVGSASKHLARVVLDDPNRNGQTPASQGAIIYWGSFTVYNQNRPIIDGKIWQAIPWRKTAVRREFPKFLDLLMEEDRENMQENDRKIIEVIAKYRESVEEFYRLEEIRRQRLEAQIQNGSS